MNHGSLHEYNYLEAETPLEDKVLPLVFFKDG